MPYAVITHVTVTGSDEELQQMVDGMVVPRATGVPGFITGVWSRSAEAKKGLGVAVYGTKDEANGLVNAIKSGPPPDAVTIDSVEVFEVVAQR
jgi:hypothetical protein